MAERQTGMKPITFKWVWSYKFDDDGNLIRFKARLCARGDLQKKRGYNLDTRAVTLSFKSFRFMASIIAAYDLDTRQFDAEPISRRNINNIPQKSKHPRTNRHHQLQLHHQHLP